MRKRWWLVSLQSVLPVLLIGADSPNASSSVFQPLADAAVACAEATQTEGISTNSIERHGWTLRYAPSPDISQFARADARFTIVVLEHPPVCAVNWSVHSPSGRAAIFASAIDAVSNGLATAFAGKYQMREHRSESSKELQQFAVGTSEVLVSVEPIGQVDINDLIRVQAINNKELPKAGSN